MLPYNAWPSIHVLLSILVVFFVRFVSMNNGTWTAPKAVVIWISCALLVASNGAHQTALRVRWHLRHGAGLWTVVRMDTPRPQLKKALTASALVR